MKQIARIDKNNSIVLPRHIMALKNFRAYRILLLFMLPGFLISLFNNYLPMVGIIMAFKRVDYALGLFKSPTVWFDNFRYLFITQDAWTITRNTVAFNLVFIFVGLVINVAVAIAMNELRNRSFARLFQTVIILPYFLSMVVVGYLVYAFLDPQYGFVNRGILSALGIDGISWYMEPKYWIFLIPFINLWVYTGMNSIIYLASITGMDSQLYEAAVVDGATKWQQIRYVTIPLLYPVMTILTLLSLGNIFRANFGLFYQATLNNPALYPVTDVIDTYVYRSLATNGSDLGMSAAASLYQSVVGCLLLVLSNGFIRKIDRSSALF